MKNNPKRRSGFTLIEVIISMTLIAIISVGIYNSYLMIIKMTKDGEVNQEAALIGKNIVEEIKAEAGSIEKINEDNLKLKINEEDIILSKNGEKYSTTSNNQLYIDGYKCDIIIDPKMTENSKEISIDYNDYTQYSYVTVEKYMITQLNSEKILDLEVLNDELEYKIKNSVTQINNNSIVLDFKNYIDNYYLTIRVTNRSSETLNLYILNSKLNSSGNRKIKVENIQGSLNEYYRYDNNGNTGRLYNVKVIIKDKSNEKISNLFQSNFVQNIDIN